MFCLHGFGCTTSAWYLRTSEEGVDPLELEFQMIETHHVGTGNQNQILWYSTKHHSSPDLELSIYLTLPPLAGVTGVCHHVWAHKCFQVPFCSYIFASGILKCLCLKFQPRQNIINLLESISGTFETVLIVHFCSFIQNCECNSVMWIYELVKGIALESVVVWVSGMPEKANFSILLSDRSPSVYCVCSDVHGSGWWRDLCSDLWCLLVLWKGFCDVACSWREGPAFCSVLSVAASQSLCALL